MTCEISYCTVSALIKFQVSEYRSPKQCRAVASEEKLLNALSDLLLHKSFHDVTVQMVVEKAGLSHGSFMGRFGSKRVATERLFTRFCDDVRLVLLELREIAPVTEADASIIAVFAEASARYEALIRKHWGVNRAMQELFLLDGEVDEQTKRIFKDTVTTFQEIFPASGMGAYLLPSLFAATQIMVTYNYNYVLGAMPASPEDADTRHNQIVGMMLICLKKDC